MKPGLTVEEIASVTGGRRISGDPGAIIELFGTDSRKMEPGALFIPLKGDRFDGHLFIARAESAGAAGALMEKGSSAMPAGICVEVSDTLRALQDLAAHARKRFSGPVIAVTGSNGKTTTREMIGAVLARKFRVLKTEGNLNNHIGLPLILLKLVPGVQAVVLEMGINHPGELTRLCEIARPGIGVITNIGESHLEGLGSLEGVARAKGELLDFLADGTAVLNHDSPHFDLLAERQKGKRVSFGFSVKADVRGEKFQESEGGIRMEVRRGSLRFPVSAPIPGIHNGSNALAAAAVGLELGIAPEEITAALAAFTPVPNRTEIVVLGSGLKILADFYNANPSSMEAALKTLSALGKAEGRKTAAVLGGMLELGVASPGLHRRLGQTAAREKIDRLFLYGPEAKTVLEGAVEAGFPESSAAVCGSHREIADAVKSLEAGKTMVLIKGSRGMKMEQVLDLLKKE